VLACLSSLTALLIPNDSAVGNLSESAYNTYYIFCDICGAHERVREKPELDPETSQLKYPIPPKWRYENTIHICPECAEWMPPRYPLMELPEPPEVDEADILDSEAASALEVGDNATLVVPEGVRAIGYKAFMCRTDFEHVVLPESLVRIDAFAFARTALADVVLPGTVRTIGNKAFTQCKKLTSVELNDTLESIGDEAFAYSSLAAMHLPASLSYISCSAFDNTQLSFTGESSSLTVDDANPLFTIDAFGGMYVHAKQGDVLATLIGDSVTTFEVHPGTIAINKEACLKKRQLESVRLPEGLAYIGTGAFRSCTELANINLPSTLRAIDSHAFADTALDTLEIPAELEYLGPSALDVSSETKARTLQSISVSPDNKRFSLQNGMLCLNAKRGHAVMVAPSTKDVIDLPESAMTVGRAAFSTVADKLIRVHSTLDSIHPRALPQDQNASFQFDLDHEEDGSMTAHIYHPPRYSLAACTLPVHLDVNKLFWVCDQKALSARNAYEQARYALDRFEHPQFLGDDMREKLEDRLRDIVNRAVVEFSKRGELEHITMMAEYGFLTRDNITDITDRVSAMGCTAATACLLDLKQHYFNMPRIDYSL